MNTGLSQKKDITDEGLILAIQLIDFYIKTIVIRIISV